MPFIIIFFIFINALFAEEPIDLGVHGQVYEITEVPFPQYAKKVVQSKKFKDAFNRKLEKAKKEALVGKIQLPKSLKDSTWSEKDYIILEQDLVNPLTQDIIYKAGTKLENTKTLPFGVTYSFCIVDFEDYFIFEEIVLEWKNECKHYVIAKGDLNEAMQLYPYSFYLLDNNFKKRWRITKTPLKLTISSGKDLQYETLDYNRIVEQVRKKLLEKE